MIIREALNIQQHIVQLLLRHPQIVFRLHVHPQLRAIAQQRTQAKCHFCGDAAALCQHGMQCLAKALTDMPNSGSTSSRRIAPGCVGLRVRMLPPISSRSTSVLVAGQDGCFVSDSFPD